MQQWIIYLNHSLCDSIIALSHIVILVLFRWIVQADTSHVREFSLIIEVNTTAVFCLYSMITSVSCVWFQTLMSVKPALITAELSWSVRTQPARSAAVPECSAAWDSFRTLSGAASVRRRPADERSSVCSIRAMTLLSCVTDVNECLSATRPCPAGHMCFNTLGSYTCQRHSVTCGRGYHLNPDGTRCMDTQTNHSHLLNMHSIELNNVPLYTTHNVSLRSAR